MTHFEDRADEARAHLSAALPTLRGVGDRAGAREALFGLAALALKAGELDRARRFADAAGAVYDGPESPAEGLLREQHLHELAERLTVSDTPEPRLTANELDAIIAEASMAILPSRDRRNTRVIPSATDHRLAGIR